MSWLGKDQYFNFSIKNLATYFSLMTVAYHDLSSLVGFFLFLTIGGQLISGTMLSFSLVPEPMLIPVVRNEEDIEDLYTDDFYWIHERGVDLIFLFCYGHLLRKLYINAYEYEHEAAWKSGVITFLLFQVVVFLGLVLCCTHLSDVTLSIAANTLNTFFFFKGKFYWWLFTDKQLNTDTIIRLAFAHYLSAFFLTYLAVVHGIDLHYDWKNEATHDALYNDMAWWDEAFSNELSCTIDILCFFFFCCLYLYTEPEALNYELFMWGDVGFITDIRFYGVAPHWYFRPFMSWLIVCPHHRLGIFGLIFLLVVIYYQPDLHGTTAQNNYNEKSLVFFRFLIKTSNFYSAKYYNVESNSYHHFTWSLFAVSGLYASSFLPYGRYYIRVHGNKGMLAAYFYLFFYLTFTTFRRPIILELYQYYFCNRTNFLKNSYYYKKLSLNNNITNRNYQTSIQIKSKKTKK